MSENDLEVMTVGHSNHPIERFLDLLGVHRVDVVLDVRSVPRSGYSPHFDRAPLERCLRQRGIDYVFLGDELGGRPPERDAYDHDGHVRYDVVAASDRFGLGLKRLVSEAERRRAAMMCSEENPCDCHRRLLVGKVLTERRATLRHIRGDGSIDVEQEVRLVPDEPQGSLFAPEPPPWRSIRSVSPNARPRTSSSPSERQGYAV